MLVSILRLPKLFVLALLFIPGLSAWEHPTTKGQPAVIFEVSPGFLYKGPDSKVSVLYQTSGGVLTDPFGGTKKIDWDPGVGLRASAMITANNKESMEFVYSGLYNWTHKKTRTATDGGVGVNTSPYTTVDWQSADRINWNVKTNFNSYELCAWFHLTPRFEDYFSFSIFAGGRAVNIVDEDKFFAFSSVVEPMPNPSKMKATSSNWLRGAELGLEMMCRPLSYFTWAIQGRAAIFADDVKRSIYLTDEDGAVVIADTDGSYDDETRLSGLVEGLPYILFQNRQLYFRLGGVATFIAYVSPSSGSFKKTRQITDIRFQTKFMLLGGNLGIGYIF